MHVSISLFVIAQYLGLFSFSLEPEINMSFEDLCYSPVSRALLIFTVRQHLSRMEFDVIAQYLGLFSFSLEPAINGEFEEIVIAQYLGLFSFSQVEDIESAESLIVL